MHSVTLLKTDVADEGMEFEILMNCFSKPVHFRSLMLLLASLKSHYSICWQQASAVTSNFSAIFYIHFESALTKWLGFYTIYYDLILRDNVANSDDTKE